MTIVCWCATRLTFRPPGAPSPSLEDVSLEIAHGRMTAILGPNGAGKTTLLKLLLGTLLPSAGDIAFGDRPVREWSRRDIARVIGVVPQDEAQPLFTVREMVAMGRYPHLGPWQRESDCDFAAIDRAMRRCDVTQFAGRWFTSLSGGEQRRVRIARALAQEPEVLVLDEPTASLDIGHEMTAFQLLSRLRNDGVTIVLATHNLNLAARFADDLVLVARGRLIARGSPNDVIRAELIERAYEWPVEIELRYGVPQITPSDHRETCLQP